MIGRVVRLYLCVFFFAGLAARGDDWPTFNHDNHRSGVTSERLSIPLDIAWTFEAGAPSAAWPGTAGQDYWHRHYNLRATVNFDAAFAVVGAGGTVYFGSSSDGKVYAIDAETGRVRWSFFTDGPVRLAPVVSGGKVYAGSDDGFVYCLSAGEGALIWKRRASSDSRLIPGNGAMISIQPVRSGLVLDSGRLYFTAGLFPNQGAFLFALDAEDGAVKWKQKIGVSPQGYMLASRERLYIPTGRTEPFIFSRADGKGLGKLPSAGGAYALLVDDVVVSGPGRGAKEITAGDAKSRDAIATFGGLRMVVDGNIAYMQSEKELSAFDRRRYLDLSRQKNGLAAQRKKAGERLNKTNKETDAAKELARTIDRLDEEIADLNMQLKDCHLWRVGCDYPYSLIMAGGTLFVGGDDKIAAMDSSDGKVSWTGKVEGKASRLSLFGGGLFVSTDRGRIHCFRGGAEGKGEVVKANNVENPYGQDRFTGRYRRFAEYIGRRNSGGGKGYCLVVDCGEGRLAYELAKATEYKIIGVEEDAEKVAAARKAIDKAGFYGRVVIHHCSADQLPYTKYFANLIVSDGALRTGETCRSAEELYGLVRPSGGAIILWGAPIEGDEEYMAKWGRGVISNWRSGSAHGVAWGAAVRGELEGAGEWTHIHAEPGNSACSGDRIVKGEMAVQWFGRPGPEDMIDRHHRNVPPLYKDGRVFVPGDCVVYGVDAYNGTVQWEIEVPNSRRLGVFLDSGSMAVDDKLLYVVAEDACYGFDVGTGERRIVHRMPQLIEERESEWGYLAYVGDLLLGSGRRKGASYTETSYEADDSLWYRNMKVVASDYVFALDKGDGRDLWAYKDGLIINTTITVGEGRMYFVETTSAAALADKLGRMPIKTLFEGGEQYLVSLNLKTGEVVFRERIDVAKYAEPVYLNYAKGVLLLSGSRLIGSTVHYYYDAFDSLKGKPLWSVGHDTRLAKDGAHGEYNRHPTIVGEVVYAWPNAYNIRTGGQVSGWQMDRRGHGCGGVSASGQCLFWRGGNPWMYDLGEGGGAQRLTSVTRPGCWINIIPAGGLVLVPEASSGCTCGFSVQTSMAFIPQAALD